MNWKLVAKSEPIEGQAILIDRDMVIGRHQQADVRVRAPPSRQEQGGL